MLKISKNNENISFFTGLNYPNPDFELFFGNLESIVYLY